MTPEGPGIAPDTTIATLCDRILPSFRQKFPDDKLAATQRAEVAREAKQVVTDFLNKNRIDLNLLDQRDLVTALVNSTCVQAPPAPATQTTTLAPPADEF